MTISNIRQPRTPEHELKRRAADEVYSLHHEMDSMPITEDIDLVWAISAPGTVKDVANFPEGMRNNPYQGTKFNEGIVNRSVEIVLEVTALRLGKEVEDVTKDDIKEHGPILFYNGESEANVQKGSFPLQNEHFKELVEREDFPVPLEKIVIGELEKANTPGQVEQISELLTHFPKVRKIAAVCGIPHTVRVGRYIEHYSDRLPEGIEVASFPVHLNETDVESKLVALEIGKAAIYAEKGDLSRNSSFFKGHEPKIPRPRNILRTLSRG